MEPTTTEIPDKLFYKASEVCQITDTQPYVLRFWESEFPQLAGEKNRSGQRVYKRADIDLVLRIKKLLYQEEYTIAGARKALEDDGVTIVEAAPGKPRSRRAAPESAPSKRAHADRPEEHSSLFGETRPESPEAPTAAAAEEQERYRALYEQALAAMADLKGELARSDEQLAALRDRSHRVAERLATALET